MFFAQNIYLKFNVLEEYVQDWQSCAMDYVDVNVHWSADQQPEIQTFAHDYYNSFKLHAQNCKPSL